MFLQILHSFLLGFGNYQAVPSSTIAASASGAASSGARSTVATTAPSHASLPSVLASSTGITLLAIYLLIKEIIRIPKSQSHLLLKWAEGNVIFSKYLN